MVIVLCKDISAILFMWQTKYIRENQSYSSAFVKIFISNFYLKEFGK
jgi:hypothetical protein